jgi:hypothetical protein
VVYVKLQGMVMAGSTTEGRVNGYIYTLDFSTLLSVVHHRSWLCL